MSCLRLAAPPQPPSASPGAPLTIDRPWRRRRRERAKQVEANKQQLDAWFDECDSDKSGLLDKAQLTALLLRLYPEQTDVSDATLESLLALGEAFDTTGDGVDDTRGVSRASMLLIIDRFGDYAKQRQFIDDAFAKFDTNASGSLEPAQLASFLGSLDASVKIDEGDVDFVLQQADVSGSGSIARDELLPAVGVWLALSKKDLGGAAAEEKPKSKACVLL